MPTPIDVTFPEGNILGVTMERLPIIVSFKADKPVSFSARIEIIDTDANRHSVTLVGAADNSTLTNFPFLEEYVQNGAAAVLPHCYARVPLLLLLPLLL